MTLIFYSFKLLTNVWVFKDKNVCIPLHDEALGEKKKKKKMKTHRKSEIISHANILFPFSEWCCSADTLFLPLWSRQQTHSIIFKIVTDSSSCLLFWSKKKNHSWDGMNLLSWQSMPASWKTRQMKKNLEVKGSWVSAWGKLLSYPQPPFQR